MSYTTFEYSNTRISGDVLEESGSLEVSVDITNTGSVTGKESVQFYVSQITTPGLARPVKELKGFDKVELEVGQTKTARARLDKYACGYWSSKKGSWGVDEEARFEVLVGKNSEEIVGRLEFGVGKGGWRWIN